MHIARRKARKSGRIEEPREKRSRRAGPRPNLPATSSRFHSERRKSHINARRAANGYRPRHMARCNACVSVKITGQRDRMIFQWNWFPGHCTVGSNHAVVPHLRGEGGSRSPCRAPNHECLGSSERRRIKRTPAASKRPWATVTFVFLQSESLITLFNLKPAAN